MRDLIQTVLQAGKLVQGRLKRIHLWLRHFNLTSGSKKSNIYQSVFEQNPIGGILLDLKTHRIISANPKAMEMFGWESIEALSLKEYLPPQQADGQDSYFQLLKTINQLIECGTAHCELSFIKNCGTIFHTELSGVNLSAPYGYLASLNINDITERKKTEQLLRSSEELFRKLYEESPIGIVMKTDKNRRLLKFNTSFQKMLGYPSAKELSQLTVEDITHPDDLEIHLKDLRLLSTGLINSFNIEKRYIKKDGSILYGNVYISSISNERGNYQDIAMIEDITEKKQSELLVQQKIKELNDKNEELQRYAQSNTELENFAYVASHDLREPLRTISGFSQLIHKKYEPLLDQDGKDYLNFIITATTYMESLVKDLLTYSRVNTQNYIEEEIKLPELLEIVAFSLHQSMKDNQGSIQFFNIPDLIYGDRSRLKQLFQNLIANAIKFRKTGVPPEIAISCMEKTNCWEFSIRDNGIGIQTEYHDKIFQLFRKLHRKDEYEGSGIGLALCKKVIEQHGGNIRVESEFGKYTIFIFTLPKAKVKSAPRIIQPESRAVV